MSPFKVFELFLISFKNVTHATVKYACTNLLKISLSFIYKIQIFNFYWPASFMHTQYKQFEFIIKKNTKTKIFLLANQTWRTLKICLHKNGSMHIYAFLSTHATAFSFLLRHVGITVYLFYNCKIKLKLNELYGSSSTKLKTN